MNGRGDRAGRFVTAAVLLLSAAYYLYLFRLNGVWALFVGALSWRLVGFMALVALSQYLKCSRMILLNIDTRLSSASQYALYAKTTLVNIILPYKIGELFRAYSYGRAINDYASGVARVFVDRLIDTGALLAYLTVFLVCGIGSVLTPYIVLMICFALMAAVFVAFPSLYAFWNDYLISKRQSPHALSTLTLLTHIERARRYIRALLRGKTLLLVLMSLAAWGAELVGVWLLTLNGNKGGAGVGKYLMSALTGEADPQQLLTVFVGVLLLLPLLFIAYAIYGRKKHGSNSDRI